MPTDADDDDDASEVEELCAEVAAVSKAVSDSIDKFAVLHGLDVKAKNRLHEANDRVAEEVMREGF